MTGVNIRFNPDRCRWEAVLDGDEVGFLDYQVNCGIVEMSRTEVDLGERNDRAPESVAQALIRAGLEQAREDIPFFILADGPAVTGAIDDNPDFAAEPWKLVNYGMSSIPSQLWLQEQFLF